MQLLVAELVCLAYMLLVLHAAPYKGNLEDSLAFGTSLCLTVSLLFGLCLIMDNPIDPVFDVEQVGIVLISVNVLPFLYFGYAAFVIVRHGATTGMDLGPSTPQNRVAPNNTSLKKWQDISHHAVHFDRALSNMDKGVETLKIHTKKTDIRRISSSVRLEARKLQRVKTRKSANVRVQPVETTLRVREKEEEQTDDNKTLNELKFPAALKNENGDVKHSIGLEKEIQENGKAI